MYSTLTVTSDDGVVVAVYCETEAERKILMKLSEARDIKVEKISSPSEKAEYFSGVMLIGQSAETHKAIHDQINVLRGRAKVK